MVSAVPMQDTSGEPQTVHVLYKRPTVSSCFDFVQDLCWPVGLSCWPASHMLQNRPLETETIRHLLIPSTGSPSHPKHHDSHWIPGPALEKRIDLTWSLSDELIEHPA